jgi:hypothetical protein
MLEPRVIRNNFDKNDFVKINRSAESCRFSVPSKKQTKKVKRYISSKILEDLKLWHKTFLPKINSGMSLNLITYRCPSIMSWSDACLQGMGGYYSFGWAWRYKLSDIDTTACQRQNNSLEFTAALISVWAAILSGTIEPESCF